ncbi:RHS repeat-associated core domain-containing protein [Pseudomonas vancouverensis]|uniref:RHS repeat-associated core domain-containing protein n=1 Tax=Pseudomonas vancouverensis TaxID=95300 RepID=UPI0012FDFEC4|nr:RHS repeat-associated core domain-containing protein [Pseudomonas vancouverensis]
MAIDLQQSVLAELDSSGPNPFAYSPYGTQSSPFQAGTQLGFNGKFKERSSGWYHLGNGHRVYNPALMRFHSPDRLSPFGKGGGNAYVYCGGSPVNRVDPAGQWWVSVVGQAIGIAVGGLFAAAPTIRTAAAIVNGQTLDLSARVANIFGFYGGVSAVAVRPLGIPAAFSAIVPNAIQAVSVGGNALSQASTFIGGFTTSVNLARTTLAKARANGQSLIAVAAESLKEVSGYNLLRRRPMGQVPLTAAHLQDIREEARVIRHPSTSGASQTTQL